MNDTGNEKTVGIKECASCGGGLIETDRFCRWCGANQCEAINCNVISITARFDEISHGSVSNSQHSRESNLYRPVSGPLVEVMAKNVSTGALSQPRSPVAQTLLAALLSFPVWLMILFLSPFDAYFAARTMAKRS